MKYSRQVSWLPLLLLIVCTQPLALRALCPEPFKMEASRCAYAKRSNKFTWCEANQQCRGIGGELLNRYRSVRVLHRMPSVSCSGCKLWFELSDLADERNKKKGGWQQINDKGNLRYDSSLWYTDMPSSAGNQDCLANSAFTTKFIDNECSNLRGFICEYVAPKANPAGFRSEIWKQTQFKRTSYNPSGEYCFKDVPVNSLIECAASATTDGSARRVLYNTKSKKCRLLQFTDAQVNKWIETGANWIKFTL